ncbi:FkbM family methyltransferase [Pseudochryseolinea flava]|uniref:Methyltransferase FkbM domain-containing protein n=1 Tax=Pseudochryseolinea flava TaxID=2059302 RepID=A0A364Y8G8_9BACT|nr:FkbM family methyltransferase [Pseudochryseolinea flava]RAW02649.1 hypothetical protein DQQ10_00635 [Pseudochryseolinea flava]
MNRIVKKIYFAVPFKTQFYHFVRLLYKPRASIAGYLKFKGVFKMHFGERHVRIFNNNLTVPTLLFWKGIDGYEPETLKLWVKLSAKAKNIFDVGANFGLFGLISKCIRPDSKVFCFEPLRRNGDLISKNNEINRYDITVVQAAVSNKEGTFTFYDMDDYDNTIGSFDKDFVLGHRHHKALLPTAVPTITIDSYVEKSNIQALDLLKIDVEGHELSAIEGARSTIAKFKPAIVIEISEHSGEAVGKLLHEIVPGYQFYAIHESGGLNKVQSLAFRQGRNFLVTPELLNMNEIH